MRVVVTRPARQLTELTQRAAERNIEVVPLPLMEIVPLQFEWPRGLDIKDIDWMFFTSAQGVASFFLRLSELDLVLTDKTRFAVVGARTDSSLRKWEKEASFQPSDSYGQTLFTEFIQHYPDNKQVVMYARARDVEYDPASLFFGRGYKYYSVPCYESVERSIDPQVMARIRRNDAILFTAPSMVRAYQRQFGSPQAKLLAIGNTTAAEMERHRWRNIVVLKQADVNTVLEYL
jgi:uroporphyrinogen-III synthase